MARRDYARRGSKKKSKKGTNKITLLLIAGVLIAGFAIALFLMKEKAPEKVVVVPKVDNTQPQSVLPNRPEEVWSYIQALETRTVPVNDDPKSLDKNMRLTEEQKKILLAMEQEQKAAEQARLKQQETIKKTEEITLKETALSTPKAIDAKAEANKPVNKPVAVVEVKKAELAKEPIKVEPVKKVDKAEVVNITTSERKYGLQCGAFKNKTQAENLQARLTMKGLHARVNSSEEWNRVIVGPIGDRASAVKAQEKTKAITNCVVIGM
ncbi:cell division protein FtsN [Pasteurella oralis]|uniref:Cell division protein FtsN n=1 Tax=Pasteurella oralis TaxID=1071947 RepID=A0ABW4NTF3_9PAST|nr:cell division protein FtsN [Pasteurella oralis]